MPKGRGRGKGKGLGKKSTLSTDENRRRDTVETDTGDGPSTSRTSRTSNPVTVSSHHSSAEIVDLADSAESFISREADLTKQFEILEQEKIRMHESAKATLEYQSHLKTKTTELTVSYTHLTLPTNREV